MMIHKLLQRLRILKEKNIKRLGSYSLLFFSAEIASNTTNRLKLHAVSSSINRGTRCPKGIPWNPGVPRTTYFCIWAPPVWEPRCSCYCPSGRPHSAASAPPTVLTSAKLRLARWEIALQPLGFLKSI